MHFVRSFILASFALIVGISPTLAAVKKHRPFVVIFRSPTTCADCASSLAIQMEKKGYQIKYVGPGETTARVLKGATMYMVPGGEDCEAANDCWTAKDRENIKHYVRNGGAYFGACLGGYWAGDWPGNSTPGFQPLRISGAHVIEFSQNEKEREPRLEELTWHGRKIWTYFQDGPAFVVDRDQLARPHHSAVIAIYNNPSFIDDKKRPTAAAFITHYGRGVVGVAGVHLEAPLDWHLEPAILDKLAQLKITPEEFAKSTHQLLRDFIDEVLESRLIQNTAATSLPAVGQVTASAETRRRSTGTRP